MLSFGGNLSWQRRLDPDNVTITDYILAREDRTIQDITRIYTTPLFELDIKVCLFVSVFNFEIFTIQIPTNNRMI
jgi:hypothetical protein